MKLYTYRQDFGRMGELSGTFLANEVTRDWFMNTSFVISDVLGKHSEVEVVFDESTIKEYEFSKLVIDELYNVLGRNISGVTPYDYEYEIDESKEKLNN